MSVWKPRIATSSRYKHQGIVDALVADINSGVLKPGDALPPQREIARQLGIDLTTVTRAMTEAHRLDLIEAKVGSGTTIKGSLTQPALGMASLLTDLDLTMIIPPQPPEADLHNHLIEGVSHVLNGASSHFLSYQESTGTEAARAAGTKWLAPRFGEAPSADRLLVAGGAQSALFAICSLIAARGSICAGTLTYPGLKSVCSALDIPIHALAMDRNGIVPDAFESCCKTSRPKAIYLCPSIDNPTTVTMPASRRQIIVSIAQRHDVMIIEDDPYAELLDTSLPAIASIAPDITWHIATLSKCATPALRVAYVVCPSSLDVLKLASSLRASNPTASPLLMAVATAWINDGSLYGIAHAIREESQARQIIARKVLKNWHFSAHPAGHHLWLDVPVQWSAAEFSALARRSGIGIVPASAFSIAPATPEAVRLSLGAAPDRGRLEQALVLLDRLLHEPRFATGIIV
ncbi:PLP-dependent aminotransferase family protein [Phyllobacterium sp. P30BS-XVII]|uniref:aminotransferase-like domain-containing protein n=1 Tax=Phyllobacterium sp. P30BS-XVII TaxID=2587046 RepID=UPI000DDB78B6|nr:PLP-dependent aminotransferase family protein [Phyllobacterium sp. P30BS-XVII]MBA8899938.1 DNA-binding transcriptional MocR family regulator [Phyllobacterium sp. P30BS-XVII]